MAKFANITKKLKAINADLLEALVVYEVFLPTGRDKILIDRVNKNKLHPVYNVISESLHKCTILSLCRIWDKKGDAIHVSGILAELNRVLSQNEKTEGKNIIEVLSLEIKETEKSDQLDAIKKIRNQTIAHTANPACPYQGKARRAVYGDERYVLDKTISVLEKFNILVGFDTGDEFSNLRRRWKELSKEFWHKI